MSAVIEVQDFRGGALRVSYSRYISMAPAETKLQPFASPVDEHAAAINHCSLRKGFGLARFIGNAY